MKLIEPKTKAINVYSVLAFFASLKILIHLVFPEYGFARDELYYLAISENFSFDNLEILPVTPLYLKLITSIFGISVKSIHFASALCGAGVIVFTGLITKELGGNLKAIALSALATLLSGFLIFGSFMSYDSIDFLIWTACLYTLVCIIKYKRTKLWIVFGLLISIGFLNKLTICLFGGAIVASLLFSKNRNHFKSIHIWFGALIALLATIPFVLWQIKTDWYYLDFVQNYAGGLSYVASFPEYLWNQFLPNNPFNAFLWIPGLFALLFVKKFKDYKFLGVAYLILFFGCFFLGTKFYFIMPFYTLLLASGSIQVISFINGKLKNKIRPALTKASIISIYITTSFMVIPLMMPILKVESLIKYAKIFGVTAGVKYEYNAINELPQHFADRFGWTEMVELIASSYEKAEKQYGEPPGIFTSNWGQASAVFIHGKKYKLPFPVSYDGWFYHHTTSSHTFRSSYITIGFDSTFLSGIFRNIEKMAFYQNKYCMPSENNKPVYYCSHPKINLKNYWHIVKSPDEIFLRKLKKNNPDSAINYYNKIIKSNKDTLLFTEAQINQLGYQFMNKGEIEKAAKIFKFNIEIYPSSYNVYDSYAEALMNLGDYENSIDYYIKSLEINPENRNAEEMIKNIEKKQKIEQ